MNKNSRLIFFLSLIAGCILLDRVTKEMAKAWLKDAEPITWLGDTFRLTYVENTGAFLSFGDDWGPMASLIVMSIIPMIVLTGIFIYCLLKITELDKPTLIALAFVFAGGVGNIIDRVMFDRHVTDFMNIGIGSLRTGIFNVADIFVTAGIIILALLSLKKKPEVQPPPATTENNS